MGQRFSKKKGKKSIETLSKKDELIIKDLNEIDTHLNELSKDVGVFYSRKSNSNDFVVNELDNLDSQLRILKKDMVILKGPSKKTNNIYPVTSMNNLISIRG